MTGSIQRITDAGLCTGCGTCAAICLCDAITMSENAAGYLAASIDAEKCVLCGKCLKQCPSNSENQLPFEEGVNPLCGVCLNGYTGCATDATIRSKAQSGGIVTALLDYLLDTKRIDGAIINRFDAQTQRPKAFFAHNREALLSGCGSYYSQSSVVDEMMRHRNKRLAVVALGCQAEAISLLRKNKLIDEMPVVIGLVCAGQNSSYMLSELVEKARKGKQIRAVGFRFRDKEMGGWPGNVSVTFEDGSKVCIDKNQRHALKKIYESYRCLLCFDQMNAFSDIVCGDPWGIDGHHKEGETVVIARTQRGEQLLRDAQAQGYITLNNLGIDKILAGQTVNNRHARKFYSSYIIANRNQWRWPYHPGILTPQTVEYDAQYEERLNYSRALYLASTQADVKALVRIHKQKDHIRRLMSYPSILFGAVKRRLQRIIKKDYKR